MALEDALRQLYILGCLDADGAILALGRRLAKLPLDPGLGRVLVAAAETGCLKAAFSVCAMLTAESVFMGSRFVLAELLMKGERVLGSEDASEIDAS